MKQGKEDRRVRITKQAIRDSLVELMQQQPIAKISVKMICDNADVNRSTFYAHYADQFDLLHQVQSEVVAGVRAYLSNQDLTRDAQITVPALTKVLEYARDNRALLTALLSENGDAGFPSALVLLAQQPAIEKIRAHKLTDTRMSAYLESFSVYGCVSIIRQWLEGGCVDEPGDLAALITKVLFEGVSWYYR